MVRPLRASSRRSGQLLKIAYLKLVARSLGIEKIIAKKIPGFEEAEWNIHFSFKADLLNVSEH